VVALSIALGTSGAAAAELAELPSEVLADLVAEIEQSDEERGIKLGVLRLLAHDPRGEVRARVVEAAACLWPESREAALELVRALGSDREDKVRVAAANSLTRLLYLASPAERVELVCSWTIAEGAPERLSMARALSSRVPVLVADLALRQLATDGDPEIRAAAIRAALQRYEDDPRTYRHLGQEHLRDPDRAVRRAARRLLAHAGIRTIPDDDQPPVT
jgi:hypothetical protein